MTAAVASTDSPAGSPRIAMRRVFHEAFIASLPVLMGYVTMGIAFGVLIVRQVPGMTIGWVFGMSLSTESGSMQFAAVDMLKNAGQYSLLLTAIIAVLINIRYSLYGLSFLRIFPNYPCWLRWLMVCGLTDESYAIISACKYRGKARRCYFAGVIFLDWAYWVAGGVIGAAIGNRLPFPTDGIEFAMVALFIVILVDLCRNRLNRFPAIAGGAITAATVLLALFLFPHAANKMLLPAMAAIIAVMLWHRRRTAQSIAAAEGGAA